VGGALPGRKVLTLVFSILAGGSHIDHADRLRAGATRRVLPFSVMAPSTLGTFLRAFTFGHVRLPQESFRPREYGFIPVQSSDGLPSGSPAASTPSGRIQFVTKASTPLPAMRPVLV
jgi:hypothetical protein